MSLRIASSHTLLALTKNMPSRSRGTMRPSHEEFFALCNERAQGKPGARCTRGLVCNMQKKFAHEHTGPAGASRPSLRDGFTAYNALSPAIGFFVTVTSADTCKSLMPASRHQDHT